MPRVNAGIHSHLFHLPEFFNGCHCGGIVGMKLWIKAFAIGQQTANKPLRHVIHFAGEYWVINNLVLGLLISVSQYAPLTGARNRWWRSYRSANHSNTFKARFDERTAIKTLIIFKLGIDSFEYDERDFQTVCFFGIDEWRHWFLA
jgi:hypothetical protein